MIDDFDECVDLVLDIEGGFNDDSDDSGGATKYGISLAFLKAEGIDVNLDGVINKNDIIYLTRPQAKQLYKTYWWDKWAYYRISSKIVRAKVLEMSIHFGSHATHKMIQDAVNFLEDKNILNVDGILGHLSYSAINKWKDYLKPALQVQAMSRYSRILRAFPVKEKYRAGWMRRAIL